MQDINAAAPKETPKKGIIIFLKSQVASLTSSSVDFITYWLLCVHFKVMDVAPASFISVSLGGITNFVVNKYFAFKPKESKTKTQALKFFIVWFGNLLLNGFGPKLMIDAFHLTKTIAKLLTGLLVGFFYNFPLYKYFVFKK